MPIGAPVPGWLNDHLVSDKRDVVFWDLGLSTRAYNVLAHLADDLGIPHEEFKTSIICRFSARDVYRRKMVGPVSMAEIEAALEEVGWQFAKSDLPADEHRAMFRGEK